MFACQMGRIDLVHEFLKRGCDIHKAMNVSKQKHKQDLGPIYTWRRICQRRLEKEKFFASEEFSIFNFSAKLHFFSTFLDLWTCFRKKRLKVIKIKVHKFFAGEEKFFVEYSRLRKLFAMCRWNLKVAKNRSNTNSILISYVKKGFYKYKG